MEICKWNHQSILGLYEVGGQGYGLVQWTPQSVLINHCQTLGISPYTDGDVQLQCLIPEITGNPASVNEWYSSSGFISNYYNSGATSDMIGVTGQEFINNSYNWEPDKLAVLFMAAYERPSYDPNINHYQSRQNYALDWYTYMGNIPPVPPVDFGKSNINIILLHKKKKRKSLTIL